MPDSRCTESLKNLTIVWNIEGAEEDEHLLVDDDEDDEDDDEIGDGKGEATDVLTDGRGEDGG